VVEAWFRFRSSPFTSFSSTRQFVADWYAWDGTSASDWTATVGTDAISGVDIDLLADGAWFIARLDNADANISRTGMTHLRIGISGGIPSETNSVDFIDAWNIEFGHTTFGFAELIVDFSVDALSGSIGDIDNDPDSGSDAVWLDN
jgi:hypothetical protein